MNKKAIKIVDVLKIISSINDWIGKTVCWISLYLCFLVTLSVIARYVFRNPIIGALQLSEYSLLFLCGFGGGYTLLYEGHVNADIIRRKFSPRVGAAVDMFTSILLFAFCTVLVWKGISHTLDAIRGWTIDDRGLSIPLFFPRAIIPIAGLLMGLQGIVIFIKNASIVFKKTKQKGVV